MELLLLLLLIPFAISFFVGLRVLNPYLLGTKQIDKLQYPTLARAQRVIRARDTKARDKEFLAKLNSFEKKTLAIEAATTKKIQETQQKSWETHTASLHEWDLHFSDITAEEDARKAAEAAAERARVQTIRDQLAKEKRERDLAMWTAQEKVRMDRFIADQKAQQALEQQQAAELLRSRENDIQALRKYYVPDYHNESSGYRIVNVHGLYVRKLPVKASRMVDNLTTGAMVSVNGWIQGEEVYGNPIWLKLANSAGWIWSGGVDNKSTTGLVNYNYMNEPGDSFVQKGFDGTIHRQIDTPSEMKTLIDQEIAAMEKGNSVGGSIHDSLDRLGDLSTEELQDLQEKIVSAFTALSESALGNPTRETVDSMSELADAKDAVTVEQGRRIGTTTNYYQQMPPFERLNVGDLWYDTSNSSKLHEWTGMRWVSPAEKPWGTIDATLTTSGQISADRISISPSITSITRNGQTVAQLGGLTAPQETMYNIFSDSGRTTNFWRGTEFEHMGR